MYSIIQFSNSATGKDSTGKDSTGDDSTGEDSTGEDSTGEDSTGEDTLDVVEGSAVEAASGKLQSVWRRWIGGRSVSVLWNGTPPTSVPSIW